MRIWGWIKARVGGAMDLIGPLAEIVGTTSGRAVAMAAWRAVARTGEMEGLSGAERMAVARGIVAEELEGQGLRAQARLIHACIEAALVWRAVMAGEELVEGITPTVEET